MAREALRACVLRLLTLSRLRLIGAVKGKAVTHDFSSEELFPALGA